MLEHPSAHHGFRLRRHRHQPAHGVLTGVMLCLFGGLLLLRAQGAIPDLPVASFWPLVLVYFGLSVLLRRRSLPGAVVALSLVGMGSALLLERLGFIALGVTNLWPVCLVGLGVAVVLRSLRPPRERSWQRGLWHQHKWDRGQNPTDEVASEGSLQRNLVMAGAQIRCDAKAFTGGTLNATLAGAHIDLREAVMAGAEAILQVTANMSGIELVVPEAWQVRVDVVPLLGGVEDLTRRPLASGAAHLLIVRGSMTLSGLSIRN